MKDLKTANKNRGMPEFIRKAKAGVTIKCNRCKAEMTTDDAEYCWFCGRMICFTCWDEFGRCNHDNDKHVKVRK